MTVFGTKSSADEIVAADVSDFNSASRAQTEAELVAGTNITITPSSSGATRQLTVASTGGSADYKYYVAIGGYI